MGPIRRAQKGQAIVLVALMMSVLLGFVALALDSGRALDARRTLQDSVDAAAVSAADRYYTALNTTPAQTAALNWSQAEQKGIQVFARNQRVNQSASCGNGYPVPTVTTPATTSCTLVGGAISLAITVSDTGPGGQVFVYSAQTTLTVALMQVLGQNPILTMQAAAAATSGDQAATPALAGLSPAGCFNNIGTDPIHVLSSTDYLTVNGDVVSAGDISIGGRSFLQVAGNVLTRCNNLLNGDHISYRCWPSFAAAPCSAPNVLGRLASTTYHYPDPLYQAPAAASLSALLPRNVAGLVDLMPGRYGATTFTSCYFLASGEYDWLAGYTVSLGLVSNELKPPDEPVYNDNTTHAPNQFWNDHYNGSTPKDLNCDGGFGLTPLVVSNPVPAGTYQVVVTSARKDLVEAPYYGAPAPVWISRESAPSMCRPVTVGSNEGINVVVSNVPGAESYNIYVTALGGKCSDAFGYAGTIANNSSESNGSLGSCPMRTVSLTCSLGQALGTIDGTAVGVGFMPGPGYVFPALGSYPPLGEAPPYVNPNVILGNLPTQDLANQVRSRSIGGDKANENACAYSNGSLVTCIGAGQPLVNQNQTFFTPGAVQMYVPSGCVSISNGGDEYLFSGYQYNWVLHYVATPASSGCTNRFYGYANTAPIGTSYAPNTDWAFAYTRAFGAPYTGGVIARTVSFSLASYLVLDFNAAYAPYPPGSRLTG